MHTHMLKCFLNALLSIIEARVRQKKWQKPKLPGLHMPRDCGQDKINANISPSSSDTRVMINASFTDTGSFS